MSERAAAVTPDELQLFRSMEETSWYGRLDPYGRPPDADPRLLHGDLIRYTAGVLATAETLAEHHHGWPMDNSAFPLRALRALIPSNAPPPRYTINDLLTNDALNDPPLILANEIDSLPTYMHIVKAGDHLLSFAAAIQEQPEIVDETSLEHLIIYNPRGSDAADEALLTARSQTTRDPLAISIRALLRLQQICDEAYREQGAYDSQGFLNLPDRITTTSRMARTGVTLEATLLMPALDIRGRLNRALSEVFRKKQSDKD